MLFVWEPYIPIFDKHMKHFFLTLSGCLLFSLAVLAQADHIPLIRQQLTLKGLPAADAGDIAVSSTYVSRHNGVRHIYFRQRHRGIEVYNAVGALHLKNGQVIGFSQNFVKNIAGKVNAEAPSVDVPSAVAAVAGHLSLRQPQVMEKSATVLQNNKVSIRDASVSPEPIRVQLVYYVLDDEVKLAYNTSWLDPESGNWWNVRVDALTGNVIDKNNWTLSCSHASHSGWSGHTITGTPLQHGASLGKTGAGGARYRAFPLGVESPLHGPRQLIADPSDSLASPFGWHDTDGRTGHEHTITAGNNVYASEDIDNLNVAGYSPDGGDSLVFDFPYDTAASPDSNLDAAITNLFVWNNYMHDVMYHYGFDEESGNFQKNNYGRGGMENDAVRADAQDGSGTNNANFSTPEDGMPPRMQMFLWRSQAPYFVFRSGSKADSTVFYISAFGQKRFNTISAPLVLARELSGASSLGCSAIENASGKIVVMDRGTCNFVTKVKIAQNAGAVAVIVVNNSNSPPTPMTGTDPSIIIPSVMISKVKGDQLKLWLASGSVNGVINKSRPDRALDSDMDNGVIAHEYGHGISTRLTGGPAVSNCLYNQEQAGEGWSDFFCLYMTHAETGLAGHARGIGTWLDNEPLTGIGIRTFRYSTDMGINPLTYNSIRTASVPHGVGAVWCTMLYDLYWNMIGKYGYDSNLYSGSGGNNRTLQLVIDGLKLQPCAPGFVDARDAIILADKLNNNGADSALIWSTFARRGLGYSARQGLSTSRSDGTEAFDMPSPSSGIGELNRRSGISFWPNPVSGRFEVMLPENARAVTVRLFDISGREVYARMLSGTGTVSVETSHVPAGLYVLHVEANGAVYTDKLVITR